MARRPSSVHGRLPTGRLSRQLAVSRIGIARAAVLRQPWSCASYTALPRGSARGDAGAIAVGVIGIAFSERPVLTKSRNCPFMFIVISFQTPISWIAEIGV